MLSVFLRVIALLMKIWKFFIFKRPHKYPPGPSFRVPFYQQRMYLGKNRIEAQKNLRKKYGDIYSLELGSYGTIVVSELNTMKRLLNSEVFSARIQISHPPRVSRLMQQLRGANDAGIVASSGDTWKEQRRMTERCCT